MKQLTVDDRDSIWQRLLALKHQALKEIHASSPSARAASPITDREVTDAADAAEAKRLEDLQFAENEVDRARLDDIEQAMGRLKAGDYGRCAVCGVDIARERLLARPTAIRCTECQSNWEKQIDAYG